MPQSIILFSHGSVLCGAGESLLAMARQLEELAQCPVGVGYLNYSEPLFDDAVAMAVADGADEIIVLPYFLVAGYFVQQQLPPLIDAMQQRYPQVRFRVGEPLRAHALMPDIVLACAARTKTMKEWRALWQVAPEYCRDDGACPLYHSSLCANNIAVLEIPRAKSALIPATPDSSMHGNAQTSTALLVMVHGSPQEESNNDVYAVVEKVKTSQKYFYTEVGFLECNTPSIPAAIENCIAAGAERMVAVPYFLHAGRHVADDLPRFLEDASEQYPQVEFLMGEYLGQEPLIAKVLLDLANHTAATFSRPL